MIHVEQLSFTYPRSNAPAVRELSFDVGDGEVFGFLGPSGAGKSTTQNVLIGLLKDFSGCIEIMGKPLSAWGPEYHQEIGVSFEFPNHHLKLTARENLAHYRALYGGKLENIEAVLELVDLRDAEDEPVSAFSKGMKNRLNVARSLLHRPRLLFLDEPTAGLDAGSALRIREIVQEKQREGITVFVTTHDMATADAICDRVAFIADGKIATIDSPEALRREYGRREMELIWHEAQREENETIALSELAHDEALLEVLADYPMDSIPFPETTLEDVFVQVTGHTLR